MPEQPEQALEQQAHDHDDEGYTGPAVVVLDGEEIGVEVLLRSRHEPFDGRLHWSGRVLAHPRLTEIVGDGAADVAVRTGSGTAGTAEGRLFEPDPWSRYRITGTGMPPFALDTPPAPETAAVSRRRPTPR